MNHSVILHYYYSQKLYRSDLNYLRGAAWIATGALQIEGSKKATDLISDVRVKTPSSRLMSLLLTSVEVLDTGVTLTELPRVGIHVLTR